MDKIIYKSSNQYLINNIIIFQTTINNNKFLIDNYANLYYEYNIYYKLIIFNDRLLNDLEIKELIEILNNFEFISFYNSNEHYENINNVILNFLNDKPIKIPRHYQVIYNNPQTHNNYNDILNTYNNYNDILNTHNIIKVLYGSQIEFSGNYYEINISVHNKVSYYVFLIDDSGNIYQWLTTKWRTKNNNKVKLSDNIIKKIKDTNFNIIEYSMSHASMPFIIEKEIKEIIKNEENQNIIDNLINENNELKKVINKNKDIEGKFLLKLKELEEIIVNKSKELEDKIKLIETRW
jgi:hypothetical protein